MSKLSMQDVFQKMREGAIITESEYKKNELHSAEKADVFNDFINRSLNTSLNIENIKVRED